jgi:hypothetical protein
MSTKSSSRKKLIKFPPVSAEHPSISIIDVGNASFGLMRLPESARTTSSLDYFDNGSCSVCSGDKDISAISSRRSELETKQDVPEEIVNLDLASNSPDDQLPESGLEVRATSLQSLDTQLDEMTVLALKESQARIEKEGVRAFSKKEIKDFFDSL